MGRKGLSARMIFSGVPQEGEGVNPAPQVLFVKISLGLTLPLSGCQERCDPGALFDLCIVPCIRAPAEGMSGG